MKRTNTDCKSENTIKKGKKESEYFFICKVLNDTKIDAWNKKIKPFTHFQTNYLFVFGKVSLEAEFGSEHEQMTIDEYDRRKENKELPRFSTYHLIKKPDSLSNQGYLWDKKPIESKDKDELDIKFEQKELDSFVQIELKGYHTYGGYYGFFRPDLIEVIHLLEHEVECDRIIFEDIERIYVTTKPFSDNICEMYDAKIDRQKAITTCYLSMKERK